MKKVLLTAGICLFAGSVFAQMKNVNAAFNEAKMTKPNFGEARKSINEALKNPDTKDLAKTWYVAGFIENKSFESDYNKTLIKQSVNEKNMYNALLDSYEKYLVAAKLDTMPNEKGKVKSKYLKDIKNTIKNNQPHFWSAGAYFYNEKDYKKAYKMWEIYQDIPKLNFMAKETLNATDSSYMQIRYYAALAAFQTKDNKLAIKALNEAKKDNYEIQDIYYYLFYAYSQEKDTVNQFNTLKEAVEVLGEKANDPKYQFMSQLINLCIYTGKGDDAIAYLKKALEADPNIAEYWKVLAVLYYENKKDEANAVQCLEKAISVKPDYAEAYGEMGRIYFNKAVTASNEASLIKNDEEYQKVRDEVVLVAYKKALPYYEKAHSMKPDENEYMIALRGIYYNLGDEANLKKIEAEMNASE